MWKVKKVKASIIAPIRIMNFKENKQGRKLTYLNTCWIGGMFSLVITIIVVTSASIFYPTKNIDSQASLDEFTAFLDRRIPALMKDYNIPGVSVAIVSEGETKWLNAWGYARLDEGRKMTTGTRCRVESISKSVTAWGVMKLVKQGMIELDSPVKQYLQHWEFPESKISPENITIRQLLSHRSGLPLGNISSRYSPERDIPSLQETLSGEAVLREEPGSSFFYSNTGFNLLELMIEEVTGRSFSEYMKEEILIPLGMHNSGFNPDKVMFSEIPYGYSLKGEAVPVYLYPGKASGGMFSTAKDIAVFIAAGMMTTPNQKEHKALDLKSITKLYSPETEKPGIYSLAFDAYGLGHFIEILPNGKKAISHGGQGYGWMSHFHSVPETGDGIVILTNSQRSWPFFANILNDWTAWTGLPSVGMGKIIFGAKVMWALIGCILFFSIWKFWRIIAGIISGRQNFDPLAKETRSIRLLQVSASIVIIAGLIWAISQDYLFISSVFPIVSGWLGYSLLILALVLWLSGLYHCNENKTK